MLAAIQYGLVFEASADGTMSPRAGAPPRQLERGCALELVRRDAVAHILDFAVHRAVGLGAKRARARGTSKGEVTPHHSDMRHRDVISAAPGGVSAHLSLATMAVNLCLELVRSSAALSQGVYEEGSSMDMLLSNP